MKDCSNIAFNNFKYLKEIIFKLCSYKTQEFFSVFKNKYLIIFFKYTCCYTQNDFKPVV